MQKWERRNWDMSVVIAEWENVTTEEINKHICERSVKNWRKIADTRDLS